MTVAWSSSSGAALDERPAPPPSAAAGETAARRSAHTRPCQSSSRPSRTRSGRGLLKRLRRAHRRGAPAARPVGRAGRGRADRAAARRPARSTPSMRAGWPVITWMRWPSRSASSGSWVTSSTVRPASRPAASTWRRARVIASSAENGSSISTTGRSSISVRASAARWRWPPDRVAGSWSLAAPRDRPARAGPAPARDRRVRRAAGRRA